MDFTVVYGTPEMVASFEKFKFLWLHNSSNRLFTAWVMFIVSTPHKTIVKGLHRAVRL